MTNIIAYIQKQDLIPFLPIRILRKSEDPFKFIIMGESEINFTAENIPILDIYNPKIIYGSQMN